LPPFTPQIEVGAPVSSGQIFNAIAVVNTKGWDDVGLHSEGPGLQANVGSIKMKARQVFVKLQTRIIANYKHQLIQRVGR
jgi:hypothetical protein